MGIYSVDNAIHLFNNWVLGFKHDQAGAKKVGFSACHWGKI